MFKALKRGPRMFLCFFLTFLALFAVCLISPQQGPVILYKLALVLLAGAAGYWLDRWIFPYARPDGYLKKEWRAHGLDWPDDKADFEVTLDHMSAFCTAMLRRAAIVGAAMLAVGLGL